MNTTALQYRYSEHDAARTGVFDAVVVGGGITGACVFHQLRQKGLRALLVDKADFAGGTSQASAMMLWGGLAYLRNFDISTVLRLSSSREDLLGCMGHCARPRTYRYVVPQPRTGNRSIVMSGLYLYWLLGGLRRSRPRRIDNFEELSLLKSIARNCFEYEEAYLPDSDARFVMEWVLRARSADNPALNYCTVEQGRFDKQRRLWILEVEDHILKRQFSICTRVVVNAAGVWVDRVNNQFRIKTPYKHLLSKGVFIGLRRDPRHTVPLIVEKSDRDCYGLIPWGPVSLWGPTETFASDLQEGFAVSAEDIRLLVAEYEKHFAKPLDPLDVVSLRWGVRGLAVNQSTQARSQSLSRKYVVHRDSELPWVSIHGGKLTSCLPIANAAVSAVEPLVASPPLSPLANQDRATPELETFPGLQETVPSARWCATESCWSIQDYLRRRTNIAQWVPRGGLGHGDENYTHLERVASLFSENPQASVAAYRTGIEVNYDCILSECGLKAAAAEVQ